jgi:hypothetical protein
VKGVQRSISISSSASHDNRFLVFNRHTPLPVHYELPLQLTAGQHEGSFHVLLEGENAATDAVTPLAEVIFQLKEELAANETLVADFLIEEDSNSLKVQILKGGKEHVITEVVIPIA